MRGKIQDYQLKTALMPFKMFSLVSEASQNSTHCFSFIKPDGEKRFDLTKDAVLCMGFYIYQLLVKRLSTFIINLV